MVLAVAIGDLIKKLPQTTLSVIVARQLFRAGTSVGANYRAACRARSRAEFIAKLGVAEEECDETLHWLEMLRRLGLAPASAISALGSEAEQLLAIIVASIRTARTHK